MKIFVKVGVIVLSFFMLLTQSYALSIADPTIVSEIQKKVRESKTVSSVNVIITSNKGIVTIDGTVDDDSQAAQLIEIAASVDGVVDIDTSKLAVKESKLKFPDVIITAKIKGMLKREKAFGKKTIEEVGLHVETIDSVVYLSGTIDDKEQLTKVMEIIKSINGVKEVNSKLNLER